jgi:hypothetical protein
MVIALQTDRRTTLLSQARRHEVDAESAAANGDVVSAARNILLALDCERRAGALGPQVLQLIKPRA